MCKNLLRYCNTIQGRPVRYGERTKGKESGSKGKEAKRNQKKEANGIIKAQSSTERNQKAQK